MNQENLYQCKSKPIPGRDYGDINRTARKIYNKIKNNTKRRPYLKSAYFKGDKVFFENFWPHLAQKNLKERKKRLKLFECGIELVQNSIKFPLHQIKIKDVILYRFIGKVGNEYFGVQIKEDLKKDQKFLMSIFQYKQK